MTSPLLQRLLLPHAHAAASRRRQQSIHDWHGLPAGSSKQQLVSHQPGQQTGSTSWHADTMYTTQPQLFILVAGCTAPPQADTWQRSRGLPRDCALPAASRGCPRPSGAARLDCTINILLAWGPAGGSRQPRPSTFICTTAMSQNPSWAAPLARGLGCWQGVGPFLGATWAIDQGTRKGSGHYCLHEWRIPGQRWLAAAEEGGGAPIVPPA